MDDKRYYGLGQIFLSASSARRATRIALQALSREQNFYPRPPQGGRHSSGDADHVGIVISIHALRKEGDSDRGVALDMDLVISIHALRKEGDDKLKMYLQYG